MIAKVRSFIGIVMVVSLFLTACTTGATQSPGGQTSPTSAQASPAATATTAAEPTATTAAETPTTAAAATETAPATAAATAAATATQGTTGGASDGGLVAAFTDAAPTLDGVADDAAWQNAPAIQIETSGGENESDTTVSIQSVYDDENVYFLLTWADPADSNIRQPWEKQADGTWKVILSPENKGGDENTFYEDKISFIWSINNSIKNFDTLGCFAACHAGENSDVKPYGNKYTDSPEETGDIWHWKSVRNVGQVDDQFLDNTQYSKDTPEAGRKSDKKDGGGYVNNETADKKMPAFMAPNGGDKSGAPGFITDEEKIAFDDSLFKTGDRLPSVVVAPFTGDRGDLSAGWKHADGKWTLEMSRALTTGSDTDVQFDDLTNTYYFGVATFDNVQVRHAFQAGATAFTFQPK